MAISTTFDEKLDALIARATGAIMPTANFKVVRGDGIVFNGTTGQCQGKRKRSANDPKRTFRSEGNGPSWSYSMGSAHDLENW